MNYPINLLEDKITELDSELLRIKEVLGHDIYSDETNSALILIENRKERLQKAIDIIEGS